MADVLQQHTVQSVARILFRRWGVGLGFVGLEAAGQPPRPRGRGLCALAQSRGTGDGLCRAHGGTGLPVCWAGLSEIAVPVVVAGETVGSLLCGGFVLDDELAGATLAEAERRVVATGVVPDALARASHPRLSPGDVNVIEELLRLCADEIAHAHPTPPRKPAVRSGYDALIGPSSPMQELYRLLDKIKDSESTVLVQGENGTGKELIAKAIHHHSPRRDRRFLVQNCSAFNDNLLDSELFGHRKGSFTGAIADKPGLFEAADGGTFFLDEIGDMSPTLQVKLLRVLQEGTFTPVGDTATRRVDVRIVAATHRDLAAMVAAGTFREDLYYRVNVINLTVPPLRERRADIAVLAEHFLKKHGRSRRSEKHLAGEALAQLGAYAWPGNVRELENEIERLVVLSGDEREIDAELLSPRIKVAAVASESRGKEVLGLPGAVAALERSMIVDALRRHGGNKTKAARELQVSRRNLIRLAQKYET